MSERQASECIRIAEDAAWVQNGDRVVVVDLARLSQEPTVLEGTAAAIWETILASDGGSLEEIVGGLAAEFALEEDSIRGDVEGVVRTLATRGMLRVG